MKILVTGGCGFIGSNFIRYMMGKYPEIDVVCVDALTYAASKSYIKNFLINKHFKFYEANITNRVLMDEIFQNEKFDYVVNFAAETSVDRSFLYPELFFETNLGGVITLLELCRKYNVKRFHQVSTDEVYGESKENDTPFTEDSPYKPTNPYSLSKVQAEMYIKMYGELYNLDYTISRCTNNYGPNQCIDKLIPLVISRCKLNYEIPVYGTGENKRDWIYVDDHSRAIDLILFNAKKGSIYNVAAHEIYSNLEVIRFILKYFNKDDSKITFVADRKYHDFMYNIDTSKIEKELGFKADYEFSRAIDFVIESYSN